MILGCNCEVLAFIACNSPAQHISADVLIFDMIPLISSEIVNKVCVGVWIRVGEEYSVLFMLEVVCKSQSVEVSRPADGILYNY